MRARTTCTVTTHLTARADRGYYDRFFKQATVSAAALRVALAFDAQIMAEVPFHSAWDESVDVVLTATQTLGRKAALFAEKGA